MLNFMAVLAVETLGGGVVGFSKSVRLELTAGGRLPKGSLHCLTTFQ